MATNPAIHTVPSSSGWVNRREGSQQTLSTHSTKAAAEQAGRDLARRDATEHIVHTRDGRIAERNSYGNDPERRKG
jgi:ketosteroid isomerase-like protein